MSSWESLLKMGVVHFMAYPATKKGTEGIAETVTKIAQDDFFQAIEISWIKDEGELERTRKVLDHSGLEVAFGGQLPLIVQGLDLNALIEEDRAKAVADMKKWMEQAVILGARGFAVLSGLYPGKDKESEAVDALIRSLKELCAEGKKKGLTVVLETFEKDVKKQLRLAGPSDLAAQIAVKVKEEYDNFGIMLDLSHLPLLKEASAQAIKAVGPHLVHAHIGSCVVDESHPQVGDTHPPFNVKGSVNTAVDVAAFLRALWDSGFFKRNDRPIVSFEVSPREGENPDVVLAGAKRVFRHAWSAAF